MTTDNQEDDLNDIEIDGMEVIGIFDSALSDFSMAHTDHSFFMQEDWSGKSVLVHPKDRGKPPSIFTGSIILLNSTVGSGVLSMPFALAHLGLVFGSLFVVFIAVLTVFSMRLLASVAARCLQNAEMFQRIDRSSSATPSIPHGTGEIILDELARPPSQSLPSGGKEDPAIKSEIPEPEASPSPRGSIDLSRPTAVNASSTSEHNTDHQGTVLSFSPLPSRSPSTTAEHLEPGRTPSPVVSPSITNVASMARPRVSFPWVAKQVAPWSSYLLDVSLILMCFCVIIAYFIVISDTAITIVKSFSGDFASDSISSVSTSMNLFSFSSFEEESSMPSMTMRVLLSRYFWIGLVFVVATPLVFFKKIDALRYLGYVNVFCVLYLTVMMIAFFALHFTDVKDDLNIRLFPADKTAISSLPIVVYGFTSQANFFAIFDEMAEPRKKKSIMSARISVIEASIIYTIIGLSGAVLCGLDVPSNIMTAFPAGEWFVIIGRFAVCINVTTCIPLCFHPLRTCIEGVVEDIAERHGKKTNERVRRYCVASIVMALDFAVAMCFSKLDVILSLAGSIGGSVVAFILPGYLFFKACPERRKSFSGVFAIFLLIFGVVFLVSGVVVTLINAIE